MRNAITRMKPKPENMVTEPGLGKTVAVLCVECGWEGTAGAVWAPEVVFQQHLCRLIAESVSISF